MDNLYIDKLKGTISDDQYEKFYKKFRDQSSDIIDRLEKLQNAENNYYITAKYLLDITNRAYDLFLSSEVEERRQLIKLVLSNLRLEGENIAYDALSPFNLILNSADSNLWRG